MLPKKLRTPINLFPKNSKTVFSDNYITIKTNPNNLSYNRLGVILGKHILKSSVLRNKLRRRIINSLSQPLLSRESGFVKEFKDLLIIVKAPMINLTKEELENLFQRYGKLV